jgi:hypothetical protein
VTHVVAGVSLWVSVRVAVALVQAHTGMPAGPSPSSSSGRRNACARCSGSFRRRVGPPVPAIRGQGSGVRRSVAMGPPAQAGARPEIRPFVRLTLRYEYSQVNYSILP